MPLYEIANLLIDSAVSLPGAPPGRRGGRAWRFEIDRRSRASRRYRWYHHEETAGGQRQRSLARDDEGDVIRFWRRASFTVSFPERRITCRPYASTSLDTLRQLLVGQVLPLVFADRGAVALHASAVRTPHGVVTFVGETRGGKSTLAAALASRGCSLVADDCAIVEVAGRACRVRPMHLGVRLWPDAVLALRRLRAPRHRVGADPGKRRVTAKALGLDVHDRPAPLHRIYLLEPAAAKQPIAIDPVSRAEAVVALLVASFQLGMDQPRQLRRSFENLSALAARVPVRRLRRPHGLRHLPELVERVLDDVATKDTLREG